MDRPCGEMLDGASHQLELDGLRNLDTELRGAHELWHVREQRGRHRFAAAGDHRADQGTRVVQRIAQADGNFGHIPQNHYYALEVLRVGATHEQKAFFYDQVLQGKRFGNALAELGTKTAHDR